MNKILITPRSLTKNGHPLLELLRGSGYEVIFSSPGKQPTEEELLNLLPGCVGMLAGVEKIDAKVLEAAKDLKIISRNGTGVDNIDLKMAEQLHIKILRAVGANARGVAELTIGLMLSMIRGIPFSNKELKEGKWNRKKGIEIEGKVLGLIGCGKVGKIVAKSALDLGMIVNAFDTYKDLSFKPQNRFHYTTLDEIFAISDVISLHCPMSEDGKPIITKETISKMKNGVYLINTARAGLVNENDILNGLKNAHIAGYAVDVFDEEPPVLNELYKHENVILTPHIGGYTIESIERATRAAVENLLKALKK